jgi:hypothetical protein
MDVGAHRAVINDDALPDGLEKISHSSSSFLRRALCAKRRLEGPASQSFR